jgi:hypothetical protein
VIAFLGLLFWVVTLSFVLALVGVIVLRPDDRVQAMFVALAATCFSLFIVLGVPG